MVENVGDNCGWGRTYENKFKVTFYSDNPWVEQDEWFVAKQLSKAGIKRDYKVEFLGATRQATPTDWFATLTDEQQRKIMDNNKKGN